MSAPLTSKLVILYSLIKINVYANVLFNIKNVLNHIIGVIKTVTVSNVILKNALKTIYGTKKNVSVNVGIIKRYVTPSNSVKINVPANVFKKENVIVDKYSIKNYVIVLLVRNRTVPITTSGISINVTVCVA